MCWSIITLKQLLNLEKQLLFYITSKINLTGQKGRNIKWIIIKHNYSF